MLSVRYGHDVPLALAELVEHHARAAGLSLDAIEAIGATLQDAEAFILASERGFGSTEDHVGRARSVAARLFGA